MVICGYHGTNTNIELFDLSHLGNNQGQTKFPGIYFSTNYYDAKNFANLACEKNGGKPKVYVAECRLDKPIDGRGGLKLFNTPSEMVRFAKEYFPGWFDQFGDIEDIHESYIREKFETYNGQYNFIVYASEESGIPLIDICSKLGFDSYIGKGEFAITSPQQIMSFMEVDHELSEEELNIGRLPAEEELYTPGEHPAFETKSNDYIGVSRRAKPYKTKPGNRFYRRVYIKTSGGNNVWFDLDMNRLFKKGSFAIKIPVIGETDEYTCVISFDEWLPILKEAIAKTGFTQLTIKRSLMDMLRFHDLKVRCSCPDFKYRFAYQLTVSRDIEGEPELRPSDETNPKNDLGKGCKHILMAMNNKIWADKVSRIIYNYLINLQRTQKMLFDRMIAPKLGLNQPEEKVEEPQVVQEPEQPVEEPEIKEEPVEPEQIEEPPVEQPEEGDGDVD